jgi:N-acetylmuramoyl-L-alanine amidase
VKNLIISPSQQNGIEEKLIQPIAQRLYDLIKADGLINVALVPYFEGDDESALWNAIQWSNTWVDKTDGEDYHFALHADAGKYARGASGLYYSENGKKFITPITQALIDITPWSDVGIRYRDNLGELKRTTAVAGLLEVSFYDNPEELAWMKTNTELIAQTIKAGIYKALDIHTSVTIDFGQKYTSLINDIQSLINKYKGA